MKILAKKYSAGLVSRGFWFQEFKLTNGLLNEKKSFNEIKALSDEENIFLAVSNSRGKETFNEVKRRSTSLDEELIQLFPKLNIANQKIVNLIAVMLLNELFKEFMIEVFQEKVHQQQMNLDLKDYRAFFSLKQRTNETVASWQEYTLNRLGSAYRTYLLEAGLLRANKAGDELIHQVLDSRLVDWLVKTDRQELLRVFTGGNG